MTKFRYIIVDEGGQYTGTDSDEIAAAARQTDDIVIDTHADTIPETDGSIYDLEGEEEDEDEGDED